MVRAENKAWLAEHDENYRDLLAMRRRQDWMAFVVEFQKQLLLNYRRHLWPDFVIQAPHAPEILTPSDVNRLAREKAEARKRLELPEPAPEPEPEPPPAFDPDVAQIIARIEADGGQVTDEAFLDAFVVDLKAAGVYSLFDAIYIPVAIKKDAGGRVSKLYDLSPGPSYDLAQADPAKQQLFEPDQADGKPWLMFDKTRQGYFGSVIPDISPPYTFFAIFGCSALSADAWRPALTVGSAPGNRAALTHYFNAGAVGHIAVLAGGLIFTPSDTLSLGQFTALLSAPGDSVIRRKGVQLVNGGANVPAISGGSYSLGQFDPLDTFVHDGPVAFAASICQAITDQQRDAIESVLESHYPSTVG